MSKSDPQVVVSICNHAAPFIEAGRTEVVKNGLSVSFFSSVLVRYTACGQQKLHFLVVDSDTKGGNDILGEAVCSFDDLMRDGKYIALDLHRAINHKSVQQGQIRVRVAEVAGIAANVIMQLYCYNLDKKDFFGSSDPYLKISRLSLDGSKTLVRQTEVIRNNRNPEWAEFAIPLHVLNDGDKDRPIIFEIYDWDKVGEHDLIGVVQVPLREIYFHAKFPVINLKKQAKKGSGYVDSGTLCFKEFRVERMYTLNDFLIGGTQLAVTVGIDFSNADPTNLAGSYHCQEPAAPNQYLTAMMSICDLLAGYDFDNKFPAFALGSKIDEGPVSPVSPLRFRSDKLKVFGVQGLINAYYKALKTPGMKPSGPVQFAPIISMAAERAALLGADPYCRSSSDAEESEDNNYEDNKKEEKPNAYLVLVLLTDGAVSDLNEAATAIAKASILPMSIVIVGVGNANFEQVKKLEDVDSLDTGGLKSNRDIVKFVAVSDFASSPAGSLAADVFAAVCVQFLRFMKDNHIEPRRATPARMAAIQLKRDKLQYKLMKKYGSVIPTPLWNPPTSSVVPADLSTAGFASPILS